MYLIYIWASSALRSRQNATLPRFTFSPSQASFTGDNRLNLKTSTCSGGSPNPNLYLKCFLNSFRKSSLRENGTHEPGLPHLLSILSPPPTLPTISSQLKNSSHNPNFSLGSSSWVAPLASVYTGDLNHNYWHQWSSFFSGKLIPGSLVSSPSPQHINLGIVFMGVNSKVLIYRSPCKYQ